MIELTAPAPVLKETEPNNELFAMSQVKFNSPSINKELSIFNLQESVQPPSSQQLVHKVGPHGKDGVNCPMAIKEKASDGLSVEDIDSDQSMTV